MKLFLLILCLLGETAQAGHRRLRHLTFSSKALGARIALDSRAITGIADADVVENWVDLSGGGRNLTSTAPRRPSYRVAARAGQPVVRFSAEDGMSGSWSETLTSETVIMAFVSTTTSSFARFFTQTDASLDYSSSSNYIPFVKNNSGVNFGGFKVGETFHSVMSNPGVFMIVSAVHSGSSITNYLNGVPATSASSTLSKPITRFGIGVTILADNIAGIENVSGDFCVIMAFATNLGSPLRRRIEQSIAFSFKVQQ